MTGRAGMPAPATESDADAATARHAEAAVGLFAGYAARVAPARRRAGGRGRRLHHHRPAGGARGAGHTCHGVGCTRRVRPAPLSCRAHRAPVPPGLRAAVYRHHRPGREEDERPSAAYLAAARTAVDAAAAAETAGGAR